MLDPLFTHGLCALVATVVTFLVTAIVMRLRGEAAADRRLVELSRQLLRENGAVRANALHWFEQWCEADQELQSRRMRDIVQQMERTPDVRCAETAPETDAAAG